LRKNKFLIIEIVLSLIAFLYWQENPDKKTSLKKRYYPGYRAINCKPPRPVPQKNELIHPAGSSSKISANSYN